MPKPTVTRPNTPRPEPRIAAATYDPVEDYDTLAELFLGEIGGPPALNGSAAVAAPPRAPVPTFSVMDPAARPASNAPPPITTPAADPIECLILGHLPVLGSAWVSQYARCVAQEEDVTVALVQVRAGYATVEVIAADEESARQPPQSRASLEAAIDAAAAVAGRWVVRVEEPDEPMVAANPRVTALTLLTSADEMAVVAAYRTLKRLLGDAGAGEGGARPDEPELPEVRVSVMGAPEDAAAAVYAKLSEATRMFIHRPIERAPGVHRVTPTSASVVLFSGPVDHGAERAIQAITAPRRRPRRGAHSETTEATPAAPAERPRTHTSTAAAPSAPAPSPAAEVRQVASAVQCGGLLASHIAGLTPVEIACPYAPDVQFGRDAQGRLHALAWHRGPGQPGLEPLTVAAAWAVSHSALLAAALRLDVAANGTGGHVAAAVIAPPVPHMFVDEPREVRRLLDADIRVHLLAPVQIDGRTGWVCRDLN